MAKQEERDQGKPIGRVIGREEIVITDTDEIFIAVDFGRDTQTTLYCIRHANGSITPVYEDSRVLRQRDQAGGHARRVVGIWRSLSQWCRRALRRQGD